MTTTWHFACCCETDNHRDGTDKQCWSIESTELDKHGRRVTTNVLHRFWPHSPRLTGQLERNGREYLSFCNTHTPHSKRQQERLQLTLVMKLSNDHSQRRLLKHVDREMTLDNGWDMTDMAAPDNLATKYNETFQTEINHDFRSSTIWSSGQFLSGLSSSRAPSTRPSISVGQGWGHVFMHFKQLIN